MALFAVSMNGLTASTTADARTLVTIATGSGSVLKLYEVFIGGENTSSTPGRLVVNRPSAVGITITAVTPEKIDPASAAATANTVASTWGTQPTLSTNDVLIFAFNGFGGEARWLPYPGAEVVVGSQGAVANLSLLRSRSGTPLFSGHIVYEEK